MAHIPAPGEVFYGEDGTTSVVLADNYNPEYEPSSQELHEYAEYIGIDWRTEPELLHLAKEGLQAPLPHAWRACQTSADEVYYFNFETGESLWDHPLDAEIKKRVTEEREKMKTSAMHNAKNKNKNRNNCDTDNDINKKNNHTKIQNTSGSGVAKKMESTKETFLSSGNKLHKLHAITPLSQVDHKNNINSAITAPSTSLTPLPMPFALSPPLSLHSHHFMHSHMTQHAPLGVKDIEAQIRKRVDDEYAVLKKKLNLEAEQEVDAKRGEMQHRLVQTKAEYEKEWNNKSRELYLAAEKQKALCRNEVEKKYKTQIKEMESQILTLAREIRNECIRSHQEKSPQEEHTKAQQELCTNTSKDKSDNKNLQLGEESRELMLYKEKLQSQLDAKVEQAKLDFAQKIKDINKENETALRQLRSNLSKESEEKLNYVKRQSQMMIAQLESKLRLKKEEWEAAQQQEKQVNVDKELKSSQEVTIAIVPPVATVTKQKGKEESEEKEKQNKEVQHAKEEYERSLQQIKDEYERKITKIQEDIRCMQAKLANNNKNVLTHNKSQAGQNEKTTDTTTNTTATSTSEIATKIIRSLCNNALNEEEMKQVQRSIDIENNKYITSLKALESRHERLMREIRQLHERKLQNIHHSNSNGSEMGVFDPRKAPEYNTTLTQRKRAWLQAHPAPKYTLPSFTSPQSSSSSSSLLTTNNKVGVGTQRMLESEPEIEVDEQEVERAVHTQICEAKQKWIKEFDVALNTERERKMSKLDQFKKEYRAQKLEEITAQLASEESHEEEHQKQELQQNEQEEKKVLEKAQMEKKNKVSMQKELEKLQREAEMNDTRYKAETEQTQRQITQAEQEIEHLKRELEELQKQDSVKENTENAEELQRTHERFLHLEQEEEKHLRSGNQIKMIRLEWEAVLTALRTAIRAEEEHYELIQNKRKTNQIQDNLPCSYNKSNMSNLNSNKCKCKDESVCAEADHPLIGAATTSTSIIHGNDSVRENDVEVSIAARTPNVNTPLTDNKQYTRIPLHNNTGLINSSRKRVFNASLLHSLNNSCCSMNSNNNNRDKTSYETISSAPTRLSAILKQHITNPRKMTVCYRDVNNSVTQNDDDNIKGDKFTNNVAASNINSEGQESWMSLQDKLHALHQALRERRSVILNEQATLKNLREEWTNDLHRCKVNKDKHQAHYLQAVKIKLEQYAHELNDKVLALKEAQSLLRLEKKRCASSSGGSNTNNSQPRRMSHQLVSIANNCQTE